MLHSSRRGPEVVPVLPTPPHLIEEVLSPRWGVEDINTLPRLHEFISAALAQPIVSIDTETYGWKADKTGGPLSETVGTIALLQIGLPEGRHAALIDVLALSEGGHDWQSVVRPLLEATDTLKIVHFGQFERAVFEGCGLPFDAGVVDTCAMAKAVWPELQKHYPELMSRSLKSLAHHLLGRDISKTEQAGDWKARPLSNSQRDYAALDVEIAADLFRVLEVFFKVHRLDPSAVDWKTPSSRR